MIYKPGRSNFVADALSRLKISVNHISETSTETASEGDSECTRTASEGTVIVSEIGNEDIESTASTTHSADQDASDLIPHMEVPINVDRWIGIITPYIQLQGKGRMIYFLTD